MSKTIVVGVTDAPAARRAVDWAAHRAAHTRDTVVLVSVVGEGVGARDESPVVDGALASTEKLLATHADRLRRDGIATETRIARGKPAQQLIEASSGATLLVIGSDYRGAGSGTARGPHGLRIAAGAHCPVAVIPDIGLEGRTGVVVGVDGSDVSEAGIRFAAAEADREGEPLTAVSTWLPIAVPLHMSTYPDAYIENLQALTEESLAIAIAGIRSDYPDLTVRQIVARGYPDAVINRHAVAARLAVVGSHGRSPIARFFLGSTSQSVLAHLATATVIVR